MKAADVNLAWDPNPETDLAGYKVYYGTAPGTYSASIVTGTQTTCTVTGLQPGTWYFAVTAYSTSGVESGYSNEVSTTIAGSDTTSPVISNVTSCAITATGALISWVTNEASDSQVEYGLTAAYGSSTALSSGMVTSHSQGLTGLAPGTLYHLRVKSKDASGNQGVSTDFTFLTAAPSQSDSTAPAVTLTWPTSNPSYSTSISPLSIRGTASDNVGVTLVTWVNSRGGSGTAAGTTLWSETDIKLQNGSNVITVTAHDAAGNAGNAVINVTYADRTPPTISNVTSSGVTGVSATISWDTDENADSQVEFGKTASYGSSTERNPLLAATHAELLAGLSPKTLYHYRVISRDEFGNLAASDDHAFTTAEDLFQKWLILPRFTSGNAPAALAGDNYTGVAVVNPDADAATLVFTALDDLGNDIAGPGISNPVIRTLNPGKQLPIIETQLFGGGIEGSVPAGWIKLESSTPDTAGFFMIFNSTLSVLDGAVMSTEPMTSFVFPEIEQAGLTRLDVANSNDGAATAIFDLVKADGTIRASATREINPSGAVVSDAAALFGGAEPEDSDYVRVRMAKGGTAFEMLRNNTGDIAVLNAQDADTGNTTLYSPQYAIGGAWRSALSIINLDSRSGSVTLRFIREDSSQIGTDKVLQVPANGKARVDEPDFFQALDPSQVHQGYVEVFSDGIRLAGSVVFGSRDGGSFVASLPLIPELQTSILFGHVASNDVYFTGVAMVNPGYTDATAAIDLYGADGSRISSVTDVIPARQRRSRLLTEYFPSLAGQDRTSGYIRIRSDRPIAAFALFGTNTLSVLSAIPPQSAK